jgi:hypothetical protein
MVPDRIYSFGFMVRKRFRGILEMYHVVHLSGGASVF